MNICPVLRMFRLLPVAAWAVMSGISTAPAQVRLPQADRTGGDDYLYPVRTMITPIVRTRPEKEDGRSATMHKLTSVIIPEIEFHSMTLRDAIEQLRLESYQRDPDPDPITRGVKIALRLPPPVPALNNEDVPIPGLPSGIFDLPEGSSWPSEQTRITLTLNKTPLLEALLCVASQAGLRLEIQEYAACLVLPALITVELSIPPETFGFARVTPKPGDHNDVEYSNGYEKYVLEGRGIAFPPGASAIYLPWSQRLIIRNTQKNIDRVKSLFSSPP